MSFKPRTAACASFKRRKAAAFDDDDDDDDDYDMTYAKKTFDMYVNLQEV